MRPGDNATFRGKECEVVETNHLGCRIQYADGSREFVPANLLSEVRVEASVHPIKVVDDKRSDLLVAPRRRSNNDSMAQMILNRQIKNGGQLPDPMATYSPKQRSLLGAARCGSSLNEDKVRRIKQLLAAGITCDVVIVECKISRSVCNHIAAGRTWGWVKV
jgi:hypothetical protein